MDDPRAAQGVEHLQVAARELLKAARSFLDVVEDVVEDPERMTGAAAGLTDLLKSSFARTPAPWEHAAWDDHDDVRGENGDGSTETVEDCAGDVADSSSAVEAEMVEAEVVEAEVVEAEVVEPVKAPRSARGARAGRVRRIAVD